MISRAHNARHRELLRGVQQLANHHITRTFLNCACSGSEVDSGTSFLGSREASGHSSFVDRKQGSSRHFMSTPSSSDLKTQDWSPFQLDSRRSLKTSRLFQGDLGWAARLGREGSREVLAGPFGQLQRRHYIQLKTELLAADNSGAKRLSCIKVLKGTRPNAAGLGDIIVCSVKEALPRGKVKKGEVVTCVVVRSAMHHERSDGGQIRFDENAAVVINKAGEPIGTRVFGPVPHELREKKFMKILTLAQQVI